MTSSSPRTTDATPATDGREIVPLGNVAKIVSGFGFPKELQGKTEGDLPFFKVGDISAAWNSGRQMLTTAQHYLSEEEARSIKARAFPKGTIVFAKIGEAIKLNRRAILGQPALVDNNVMGLIPDYEVVDHRYLFYWTLTQKLGDISQATTVPSVRKSDVEELEFPLVHIDQQKLIVAEIEKQFSRLDDAVANLKRVKASLKRYKAAVLKAAVEGRLVETEAELARGEGLSYETGAQLLQRILETRRSQWKGKGKYKEPAAPDTKDLPELPKDWAVASLEQLTSGDRVICYGILMPKENVPNGILYVKVKDLKGDKVDIASLHRTTPEIAAKYARASLRTGDLLLAIRGTYGRVAEVPPELDGGNITQDTARLVVSPLVDNAFIACFLRSLDAQNYFKRVARGVAVKGVNIADVRICPVPLPSLRDQQRIAAEVDRRLSLVREVEAQVNTNLTRAARLRQAVLSRAFSGSLVVASRKNVSRGRIDMKLVLTANVCR